MCEKPHPPKETPPPSLVNPCPDQPPFNIVFYESNDRDSGSFQGYANRLAAALGALKMPYSGCSIQQVGAAIPEVRAGNVLERARRYSVCLCRKIGQLHMIGHIWPMGTKSGAPGPSGMSGNITADQAARFVPDAKIVLHGCDGVANASSQTAAIIKAVPKATVYIHFGAAEAGGPLNFHKQSAATGAHVFVKKMVDEAVGFTLANVDEWAHAHITDMKNGKKDAKALAAIRDWLTLDAFNSWESYRFAQLVIADPAGIPQNIVQSANVRIAKWTASQTGGQQAAPPTSCPLPACPTCTP